MHEIKCPNCGQVFQVDESGYAQIVQQIRDREFAQELDRREQELKKRAESDLMVVRMEEQKSRMEELSKRDAALSEKERLIEQLKSRLANGENEKKLAVSEAVQAAVKENDSELGKKNEELASRDREIERLKAQIANAETEKKLAQQGDGRTAQGKIPEGAVRGKAEGQRRAD